MTDTPLPHLLTGFNQALLDKLDLGRKTAIHPVAKGDASENSWLEMMNAYLPKRYVASKGFVVDSQGSVSDQIDLIIFDRQYSPFIFKMDSTEYVPAESVYAAFEVKQSLNRDNLIYAQKKIASVRKLARTSLPVPNIYGKSDPKEPPYIHGGLLCFNSEWTPPFGQSFESAMSAGKDHSMVNLTCVAQSGVFELDDKTQTSKITDRAVTYFFFRLLSILQQKATVPMMDVMAYAAWLDATNTPKTSS